MSGTPDLRPISTSLAPKAIGPYSQAIQVSGVDTMLFCSGQLGLDPATGQMVEGGVEAEARCALANLRAVIAAAGMSMANVVRTTIYLVDLGDFTRVNAIYEAFFATPAPARVTIGVAALPRGARVEIEAIAVAGSSGQF